MAVSVPLSACLWILVTLQTTVTATEETAVLDGISYTFFPKSSEWGDARDSCHKRNLTLLHSLSCTERQFLSRHIPEDDLQQHKWWVAHNFSVLTGNNSVNPSENSSICVYVIWYPTFEAVTTNSCSTLLGFICTNATSAVEQLIVNSSTGLLQSVVSTLQSAKLFQRRKRVATLPFYQAIDANLNNITNYLNDINYVLHTTARLVEIMEQSKVKPTYEEMIIYLQAILNASRLQTDSNLRKQSNVTDLMYNCTSALLMLFSSRCSYTGGFTKEQYVTILYLVMDIYVEVGDRIALSGNGTCTLHHAAASIYITSVSPQQLPGTMLQVDTGGSYVMLPSASALGAQLQMYTNINVQLFVFNVNPFPDAFVENVTGAMCSLTLTSNSEVISLTDLSQSVQIFLHRHDAPAPDPFTVVLQSGFVFTISFNMTDPSSTVVVTMQPNETVTLQLNLTQNPSSGAALFSTTLNSTGGYRWLLTPEMLTSADNESLYIKTSLLASSTVQNVSLDVSIYPAKCLFWDETQQVWSTYGCMVGPQTQPNVTQCLCNHLTMFGSSILVMPNHIDLSRTAEYFATIKENYVVPVLLGVFFSVYFMALIWACCADKKAFRKRKITLLEDNHPCSQYSYLLSVYTGHRSGAGTSAQVSLTLLGSEGESDAHHLADADKPLFERGGVDMFLLTMPFSLGELKSIRLSHDNSGGHPSWYICKVTIQDLQTRRHWHFLCSTWLSSVKGDGMTKRIFHTAQVSEIYSFGNIFQTRTSTGFRDEHIWLSVVDPPRRSPFTRAQRVSCCMCLLLCTMAINIMFWKVPQNKASTVLIAIGSMKITMDEIMVGIESGLLMFPINILIITIFRSTKPRLSPPEDEYQIAKGQSSLVTMATVLKEIEMLVMLLSKSKKNKVAPLENELESYADLYPALDEVQRLIQLMQGESSNDPHWCYCSQFVLCCLQRLVDLLERVDEKSFPTKADYWQVQNTVTLMLKRAEMVFSSHMISSSPPPPCKKESSGCWLPWWFVFVGWFLLFSISGVSTFFTLLYGFVYGKESTTQWVISLALSLFQSIFVLQPLKVIGLAIFFALTLKTVVVEESDEVEFILAAQRKRCSALLGGGCCEENI